MSHDRGQERDQQRGEEPARGAFVWPPRAMVEVKGAAGRAGGGGAIGGRGGPRDGRSRDRRDANSAGGAGTGGGLDAGESPRHAANAQRGRGAIATGWTAWGFMVAAIEDVWLDTTRPALWRRLLRGGAVDGPRAAVCARCGRERGGVGAGEGEGGGVRGRGCEFCDRQGPAWSEFVRVGRYRGVLRDAIRELKFERGRATGVMLGKMLGRRIAQRIVRLDRTGKIQRVVLVPMPTTRWRRLTRGIDHARVITRAATVEARRGLRASGHPAEVVMADLLSRRGAPSQTRVTGSERRRNVAGVFRARGVWWERAARRSDTSDGSSSGVKVGRTENAGKGGEDGQEADRSAGVGAWRRVLGAVRRVTRGVLRPLRRIFSPWRWVVDGDGKPARGVVIVGVDDISTTGATMHQAIRAIERAIGRKRARQGGVELWGASVAVTGASESDKDAAEAGLRGIRVDG